MTLRSLGARQLLPHRSSWRQQSVAYRSIFKASNWLFDPLVLAAKLVRKLTGILELPGIFRDAEGQWSLPGFGRRQLGIRKTAASHVEPKTPVAPILVMYFVDSFPTWLVPQYYMALLFLSRV
jgi:hypothetical protein